MLIEPEDLIKGWPGRYFYLASPYSKYAAGLDEACCDVAELAAALIARKVPVYSPIVHSHIIALAGELDFKDYDLWLGHGAAMAAQAAGMIVAGMPGWRDSYGIGEELKWFREMRKPIYLLDAESLCLQPM